MTVADSTLSYADDLPRFRRFWLHLHEILFPDSKGWKLVVYHNLIVPQVNLSPMAV